MSINRSDDLLAKWLSGTLSPEEQTMFEKTEAYADYHAIMQGASRFSKPVFDKMRLQKALMNRVEQESHKKTKVIRLRPFIYAASIAASIVLILGLFFNKVEYTTPVGEQITVTLPDASEVQLNAGSTLSRKRFFWNSNKVVHLEGEGFFNIEKGEGFSVMTNTGTVAVLGTQFNIRAQSVFELNCYEGKVRFTAKNIKEKEILTSGEGIVILDNLIKNKIIKESQPLWLSTKQSHFDNIPLTAVLETLERHYGFTFENTNLVRDVRFTGSFVHDDLDLALKTVLVPAKLEYTKKSSNSVILKTIN